MKVICVALLACLLVPALALAQEGAPAQGNLNTITGVTVRGGTVEITGTKKPNFTTFTMTDPPRLVIDISEAVFSGVKEDITVGNGTITAIRTASYGSDESAIARVLIGFERDVDPDIQANGNSLVVSVGGGGGAAVAARPSGPAAGTAPAGTGTGTAAGTGTGTGTGTTAAMPGTGADQAAVVAQADRQQQEKASAQSAAAAQTDRQQQEKAVAQSTAAAQTDRQQQEKAAAQAAAAAQADAEARRQAQAKADADRKAQEEAARVAAARAEQQRQQQARAEKEAAAAAEKQRQDEARAAAEEKKHAAAEEKKRQQEEARAAAEEKKRAAAEEKQHQREEARAAAEEKQHQRDEARQARVAQAERPAPHRAAPEQGGGADVSSRRKTMTLVGFRQDSGVARVFVRTNEPVHYTVSEGASEVVLELENTRIAESNNTLPLDTSFFNTAVASVAPRSGPSSTVRVAIKLKARVPYQTRQDGNELSIEFQRPSGR
jgi:colicin import membrane protein